MIIRQAKTISHEYLPPEDINILIHWQDHDSFFAVQTENYASAKITLLLEKFSVTDLLQTQYQHNDVLIVEKGQHTKLAKIIEFKTTGQTTDDGHTIYYY